MLEVEQLLEFKDVFCMDIQRSKRDSTKIGTRQKWIRYYYTIGTLGQVHINPNYAATIKQYIDKLLTIGFIQSLKETTWLSPIVIVPKKNGNLKICIDFKKLNVATKKDPFPLPFIDEVMNTIMGYESYSFLDGYLGYHQILIAPKDKYKIAFVTN